VTGKCKQFSLLQQRIDSSCKKGHDTGPWSISDAKGCLTSKQENGISKGLKPFMTIWVTDDILVLHLFPQDTFPE